MTSMANFLNSNNSIEFISAETLTGLRAKLRSIKTPYGISEIYHDGKNHVAWIKPDRILSKREVERINRADSNEA